MLPQLSRLLNSGRTTLNHKNSAATSLVPLQRMLPYKTSFRMKSKRAAQMAARANILVDRMYDAVGGPEQYSRPLQFAHWGMAIGILTCFGLVQASKYQEPKSKKKHRIMFLHKSVGLLMLAAIAPRMLMRTKSPTPPTNLPQVPGPKWQHVTANLNHRVMYGIMLFMPVSGLTMGYFGGKGVPFFGIFEVPGSSSPNKTIATYARNGHRLVGQSFEYIVLLHVVATTYHVVKGQNILLRINPFGKDPFSHP